MSDRADNVVSIHGVAAGRSLAAAVMVVALGGCPEDAAIESGSTASTGTTTPAPVTSSTGGVPTGGSSGESTTTGGSTLGAASTTASTTATDGTTAEPPPHPGGFFPEERWVLRDRDGVRVQALVEPRCGYFGGVETRPRCLPLEFGSANDFPCVRVIDIEGKYVDIQYELKSGKLGPCNYAPNSGGDIDQDWNEVVGTSFTDPQCGGTPYTTVEAGVGYFGAEFTRSRELWFAEGKAWFVSKAGCLTTDFWGAGVNNTCVGPFKGETQCPLIAVPGWVEDLLPNPPYTMAVEYG